VVTGTSGNNDMALVPVTAAGLRNATGEYNCFLNTVVQCLWNCQSFKQQLMAWDASRYEVRMLCSRKLCTCHAERLALPSVHVQLLSMSETTEFCPRTASEQGGAW
jgi:hypothetical protein